MLALITNTTPEQVLVEQVALSSTECSLYDDDESDFYVDDLDDDKEADKDKKGELEEPEEAAEETKEEDIFELDL